MTPEVTADAVATGSAAPATGTDEAAAPVVSAPVGEQDTGLPLRPPL
ncbi:MAG: hypothetical protein JWQ99_329, partial [Blastococcus sp.]|nr:hypothetical protein [Blastococcus sp.]